MFQFNPVIFILHQELNYNSTSGGSMMFKAIFEAKEIHPNRALLYIAFSATLWSTSGLFIKLIGLNPLAIAGLRSAIAAVVILLVMRDSTPKTML